MEETYSPFDLNYQKKTTKIPSIQNINRPQNDNFSFRHIYSGHMTFWRERITVDIDIVEHLYAAGYEISVYNSTLSKEYFPRIYLSSELLIEQVRNVTNICEIEAVIREDILRKKNPVNVTLVKKEALDKAIIKFILNRLSIDDSSDEQNIILKPHFGDEVILSRLAAEIEPTNFQPYQFTRKEIKSGSFAQELSKFQTDSSSAKNEVTKATRLRSLSITSMASITDTFRNLISRNSSRNVDFKTSDSEVISDAKKRWRYAAKKVVLQHNVAQMRQRLASLQIPEPKFNLNNQDNAIDEDGGLETSKSAPDTFIGQIPIQKFHTPTFEAGSVPCEFNILHADSYDIEGRSKSEELSSKNSTPTMLNQNSSSSSSKSSFLFSKSLSSDKIKEEDEDINKIKDLRKWRRLPPLPRFSLTDSKKQGPRALLKKIS